jgi:UDP-N-acetylglucosamine--N-acetylmuramyl-(pentapeptide) pyrophosphoryl-undecaprenol N-acetylglucosamine transferase
MNIAIAGGGTGGHLFPGVAIAQEFLRRDVSAQIVFLGTEQGLESRVLPKLGLALATIPVMGFKGKGMRQKFGALLALPRAFLSAASCLRRHKADLVLGLGGYISFPGIIAAKFLGIPAAIHEQNSLPGLSNRILGTIADRVFISYEESRPFFYAGKTFFSGMPVRMSQHAGAPGPDGRRLCVFICGGSQGAHAINEAMMEALPDLESVKGSIRFIHQTGAMDAGLVSQGYEKHGFTAEVSPFIDDMYSAYGQAHVVVSRAGASTLAELALCGKPSILIPYPYAAHNHQEHNARAFVAKSAAVLLLAAELNGRSLALAILAFHADRKKVADMAEQVRLLAQPDAAGRVVEECCRLAAVKGGAHGYRSYPQQH